MHIAIAGGHSAYARGASGFIDEYDCDRELVAHLIPAFEDQGWYVTDCSNDAATVNGELAEECRAANESGADLFVAVHFNAGGGTGTEVWYHEGSSAASYAESVSAELASALGLRNRGPKATTGLYVLNRTTMPAILVEVCFVDTEQDADAWHAAPWDALVGAVVRGLGGDYEAPAPEPQGPTPEEVEAGRVAGLPDALKGYDDLWPGDWCIGAAEKAVERGIMRGTSATTFDPWATLTRAMAVSVVANLVKADVEPLPFDDIAEWYTAAMVWAAKAGIVSGNGGSARPNDPCTRAELAVMLWRSQGEPDPHGTPAGYPDWHEVPQWAQKACAWAVENAVMGSKGEIRPDDACTRAEAAAMATAL